jgi:hypothetical protein
MMQRLIETLHLLANPPDVQRVALPDYVAVAEELALIFSDELATVKHILRPLVGDSVYEQLLALESFFDRMSNRPEYWSVQALYDASEWATVRGAAKDILSQLGEHVRSPILNWITYVPGGASSRGRD